MDTALLSVCGVAFAAVFFLLSFFAALMWGLTLIFPPAPEKVGRGATASVDDPALIAAIFATMGQLHPNFRITQVEEL